MLGITYPTLWSMVRDGRFPAGRYIGTRLFWRLSEVNAFIEALPRQARRGEPPTLPFPGATAAAEKNLRRRLGAATVTA